MSKVLGLVVLFCGVQLQAAEISTVTSISNQIAQSKCYDDFGRISKDIRHLKTVSGNELQGLEQQMRCVDESIRVSQERLDRLKNGDELHETVQGYLSFPENYCYKQDSKISESVKMNLFEIVKARRALENEKYNQFAIHYWQDKLEQAHIKIQDELSASFATKKYGVIAQLLGLKKESTDLVSSHMSKQKLIDSLSVLTEQLNVRKACHEKTLDTFALLVRRAVVSNTQKKLQEEKMVLDEEKLQEAQRQLEREYQFRLQEERREQEEAAIQEQLRLKERRAEQQRQKAKQAQEKLKIEQKLAQQKKEEDEKLLEEFKLQAEQEANIQRFIAQKLSSQPVTSATNKVIQSLIVTSVEVQHDVVNYTLSESDDSKIQKLVRQRRKYFETVKNNDKYLGSFMEAFDAENQLFCQEHLGCIQIMYVLDDLLKQQDLVSYYKLLHDAATKTNRAARELLLRSSHINKYFSVKEGLVRRIYAKLYECDELCKDISSVLELKNQRVCIKNEFDTFHSELVRLESMIGKKDKNLKKQIAVVKSARDQAAQRFDKCERIICQFAVRDDLRKLAGTMVADVDIVCNLTPEKFNEVQKNINSFVSDLLVNKGYVRKADIEDLLLGYFRDSNYHITDVDDAVKNFSQHVIRAVFYGKIISAQDLFVVMMTGAGFISVEYESCFADLSKIIVCIINALQESGVGIEELSSEEKAERALSETKS